MANPIKKKLTPEEFKNYVDNKFFGFLPANKLILHHTYKPNLKTWRGIETINALDKYFRSKGWDGLGPHLFIAPEGIWLFSDMRKNGIHAGKKGNKRSIGIEMVGNYQEKKPTGLILDYMLYAITVLNNKLKLKPENIKFHRDYMATACPGKAVNKSWVIHNLKNYKILPDFTLIKDRTKKSVFFVKNNIKYPIPDWTTFIFFWSNQKILTLSSLQVNQIKTGKILPSVKNLV